MSKTGKKYKLSSAGSDLTANFYNSIRSYEIYGVKIDSITENYNSLTGMYEGKITISGESDYLLTLSDEARNFRVNTLDSIFHVDTHYEELLELKIESAKSASLNDSLNLYKYKNPLEYNFLIRNYEDFLTANQNIQETALPYFYEVLEEFIATENVEGFGTTFFETPTKIITSSIRPELKTNIIPYAVLIDNQQVRIDKYLQNYNIYKEQFPFYADISFDTHELKENSLIDALNEKNLFSELLSFATAGGNQTKQLSYINLINGESNSITAKEINVNDFLNSILDTFVESDFTYIFDINQRIHNKARDFSEILMGEPEYSEVIGYHLKKFDGDTNSLIQEWFFPNISEAQMTWIDSQIKYNKLYTYKLDPIVLTFGTDYKFTNIEFDNAGRLVINFVNNPLMKTYIFTNIEQTSNKTLGAEYANRLLDYPPLEPEVELVPYIGVDNKIKINLNTSTGLKTVAAVNFAPTEEVAKDSLRLAQNKDTNSPLLTFQTDEPADFIEIYKLEDTKPSSYEEFFNKSLVVLSTNKSSGASFIDTVQPNKKYYYVARCIDYHANVSNPTPVYELEILNDNGLIIPYIKIVDFDKKENLKQLSKSFKRFLKIQPAIRHRLVNYEKTDENDIELGTENISPWNKRFKLRFISKSTGKKIDVNFTFKYNKPE